MPTIKIKNMTFTFSVDTKKYPPITRFRDEHFFLSNFYPCDMNIGGITYKNAEAAFQSMKCKTLEDRKQFSDLDPKDAKRLGRKIKLKENWENEKVDYMRIVIHKKFSESGSKNLLEKLIKTFPCDLIEENDWNDSFWGVCNKKGKNVLGKILEEERWQALQEAIIYGNEDAINILSRVGSGLARIIIEMIFNEIPIEFLEIKSSDVEFSEIKLPDVELPEIELPDVELPDVELPELNANDINLVQKISDWLLSKKNPSTSQRPTKTTIKLDGITITFF